MFSSRRAAVGAGLLASIVSLAHANSVSLTIGNPPVHPGLLGGLDLTFVGPGGSATYNGNAYVGRINWTVSAGTQSGPFATGHTLSTYCIQGLQDISYGTYNYSLQNLDSSSPNPLPYGGHDQDILDSLAAQQIQGLYNAFGTHLDASFQVGNVTYNDNVVDAAFQLAIWEIEYDGGTGGETFGSATDYFSSTALNGFKDFHATGTTTDAGNALTLATHYLNNFTPSSYVPSIALASANDQDQVYLQPVPLPAALPAGALVLAGLLGFRLYRKRAD